MAPSVPVARRRNLQVYATDPMSGRRSSFRVVVDVLNEPNLAPGRIWGCDTARQFDGNRGHGT